MSNEVPEASSPIPVTTQNNPSLPLNGRGWPVQFSWLRKPPLWFSASVSVLTSIIIVVLVGSSLAAIARIGFAIVTGSATEAVDASKAILPVAAAAVGLPLIIWRLVILAQQTRIADEKGQIDRETQFTTIFSKSIEQLGSTREFKESVVIEGKPETISRTVPNIEMRLGGIHSLFRLSAESKKDAPKIEKMLLSYIRENSWHDNSGARLLRLPSFVWEDPFDWAYDLGHSTDKAGDNARYNSWIENLKSVAQQIEGWIEVVPESRADIGEIALGFPGILLQGEASKTRVYRDSLFSHIVFSGEMLRSTKFERCTFFRCEFYADKNHFLEFTSSRFVYCSISSVDSTLKFLECYLYKADFNGLISSNVNIINSNIHDCSFVRDVHLALTIEYSMSSDLAIRFSKALTLQMLETSNINFRMRGTLLSPESTIEGSSFVASGFRSSDLTALSISDPEVFNNSSGSRDTIHPGTERPPHWPVLMKSAK